MNILLTEQEVRNICLEQSGDNQRVRAIQLALIEKMRKESFWLYPYGEGWRMHLGDDKPDAYLCDQYGRLPTPQELEEA